MPEYLHAWIGDEHVGVFEKASPAHRATFMYDRGSIRHLSLSLPYDGPLTKKSPQNFLDGLIPEDPGAKENMRELTHARSTESWDLLSAANADLPGGVLLTTQETQPGRGEDFTELAQESEISARITEIKRGGSGLGDFSAPPRFSLAGAQGKFALTIDRGEYFWPDAATPSTHIVKPARTDHPGLDEVEAASLDLAQRMGISAAESRVAVFHGQTAFMTKRFDRAETEGGAVVRLHTEDVAQALGFSPEEKYVVGAQRTIGLLRKYGVDENVRYDFIEQLAFNITIGNADAHAKNYTLMHQEDGVTLSPIYDTVPIALMPGYEQKLGMRVGNQRYAKGVAASDWVRLSRKSSLDVDRVLGIVQDVNAKFLDHVEETLARTKMAQTHPREMELLLRTAERAAGLPERSDRASTPIPISRVSNGQDRRKDRGLDKTAAGGNGGSFTTHQRPSSPPPSP